MSNKRGRGVPTGEAAIEAAYAEYEQVLKPEESGTINLNPLEIRTDPVVTIKADRPRRGVPSEPAQPVTTILADPNRVARWLIMVSTTVFEGYASLTESEAKELQDELNERKEIVGNVYLRATQRVAPTDYTDVRSIIADIELAVPAKRDGR